MIIFLIHIYNNVNNIKAKDKRKKVWIQTSVTVGNVPKKLTALLRWMLIRRTKYTLTFWSRKTSLKWNEDMFICKKHGNKSWRWLWYTSTCFASDRHTKFLQAILLTIRLLTTHYSYYLKNHFYMLLLTKSIGKLYIIMSLELKYSKIYLFFPSLFLLGFLELIVS